MKVVISDSSTLIVLLNIDKLYLLFELFKSIIITKAVYQEVTEQLKNDNEIDTLISQNKIEVKNSSHNELFTIIIKELDLGESESIALAKELNCLLIIDEKKGRNIAQLLGIDIVGLIGILLKLIKLKKLTKNEALEIIDNLQKKDFRVSEKLVELIKNI